MRALLRSSWVLAAALLVASRASATTMVELSLDQMIAESEVVVHGVVVATGTRVVIDGEDANPTTIVRVKPLAWLKGDAFAREVVVRERGGTYAGRTLRIEGTPRFRPNEEIVLFLERGPDGELRTYGMVQGKFEVRPAGNGAPKTVVRDFGGVTFADWTSGEMHLRAGGVEPASTLDSLLEYIEARARTEDVR